MDRLLKDLRYSVRSLLKQPTFSVVAFITLALGIGANTAIFSVINALILSPPKFKDPDRIVAVWHTPSEKRIEGYVSYLDFEDWRTRSNSFEDLAAYKPASLTLTENGESERLQGMRVSANFFPLLKVKKFSKRPSLRVQEPDQKLKLACYENARCYRRGSRQVHCC